MTREQMDQWLKTEEKPRELTVYPEEIAEERRERIKFWIVLLAPLAFWMALGEGGFGDRLLFGICAWFVTWTLLAPLLLFSPRNRGRL